MTPISVVIATFNGASRLGSLLEALQAQRLPGDEILVVDDASTDGTAEIARRLGATVISNAQNRGVGYGRNAGAAAAKCEVLAFFDDDVVPAPNYLEIVRREMADPEVVCIQGAHSIEPAGEEAGFWGRVEAAVVHYHATVTMVRGRECLVLYSGAFCMRRQTFSESGGFVEDFRGAGGEEFDLGMRLLANCRLTFVPDLSSQHRFKSLGHRLGTLRRRARNYLNLDRRGRLLPAAVAVPEKLRLIFVAFAVIGGVGVAFDAALGVVAAAGLLGFLAMDTMLFRKLFRWRIAHLLLPLIAFRLLTYLTIGWGIIEGMALNALRGEVPAS